MPKFLWWILMKIAWPLISNTVLEYVWMDSIEELLIDTVRKLFKGFVIIVVVALF